MNRARRALSQAGGEFGAGDLPPFLSSEDGHYHWRTMDIPGGQPLGLVSIRTDKAAPGRRTPKAPPAPYALIRHFSQMSKGLCGIGRPADQPQ